MKFLDDKNIFNKNEDESFGIGNLGIFGFV